MERMELVKLKLYNMCIVLVKPHSKILFAFEFTA